MRWVASSRIPPYQHADDNADQIVGSFLRALRCPFWRRMGVRELTPIQTRHVVPTYLEFHTTSNREVLNVVRPESHGEMAGQPVSRVVLEPGDWIEAPDGWEPSPGSAMSSWLERGNA